MKLFSSRILFLMLLSCSLLSPFSAGVAQEMESPNYRLEGGTLNSGGGVSSSSSYDSYSGIGDNFAQMFEGTNYELGVGSNYPVLANVPSSPMVTNDGNWFDQLNLVVDPTDNPADTLFAISVSLDGWETFSYVQDVFDLGEVLGGEDWLTYDQWGEEVGVRIVDLLPGQTYCFKVRALNGDFTGTRFGPEACATTLVSTLRLVIYDPLTEFAFLDPFSVHLAQPEVGLEVTTNVLNGYTLQLRGQGDGISGGMYSSDSSYLIPSWSGLLQAGVEGYGLQASSPTATLESQYAKVGDEVGIIPVAFSLLASNTGPVIDEVILLRYLASVSTLTPAGDYEDRVTFVVLPNY